MEAMERQNAASWTRCGGASKAPKLPPFSRNGSRHSNKSNERRPARRRILGQASSTGFHEERDSMLRLARWTVCGLLFWVLGTGNAAASGWQHIGNVQRVEKLPDGVELT